jgi:6-phosphogluconolactonase
VPERNVHRVATVDITPEESAANYEEGIRRVFAVGEGEVPRFDLILLGLGPDGHTASLFPGSEALHETTRLVVPNFVEKFNSWRITFTYRLINAGKIVAFLSQGPDKAERVRQVLDGQADLPASGVHPSDGTLFWWIDRAAASQAQTGGAAT